MLKPIPLPLGALVSKSAEIEARVLLPLGEGGPKGRMRAHFQPTPGASRHPLPKGEGHFRTGFQIENPMKTASLLLLERTASRDLDKSGIVPRGTQLAPVGGQNWSNRNNKTRRPVMGTSRVRTGSRTGFTIEVIQTIVVV